MDVKKRFSEEQIIGFLREAEAGKAIDGKKLLSLFALLMMVVGVLMLRGRGDGGNADVRLDRSTGTRLATFGGLAGAL
nr:hypothetical protein [Xanthomonas oryzae]